MLPSDFTTASFGELSRLPCQWLASTVTLPSCSVRVTQRVRCWQLTSRPCRSVVFPLELSAGCRNTEVDPSVSSHRIIRLLGMSDHTRYLPAGNHAGPSAQRQP